MIKTYFCLIITEKKKKKKKKKTIKSTKSNPIKSNQQVDEKALSAHMVEANVLHMGYLVQRIGTMETEMKRMQETIKKLEDASQPRNLICSCTAPTPNK